MQTVVILIGVFEKAIHWIEHLMRQQEKPLPKIKDEHNTIFEYMNIIIFDFKHCQVLLKFSTKLILKKIFLSIKGRFINI